MVKGQGHQAQRRVLWAIANLSDSENEALYGERGLLFLLHACTGQIHGRTDGRSAVRNATWEGRIIIKLEYGDYSKSNQSLQSTINLFVCKLRSSPFSEHIK